MNIDQEITYTYSKTATLGFLIPGVTTLLFGLLLLPQWISDVSNLLTSCITDFDIVFSDVLSTFRILIPFSLSGVFFALYNPIRLIDDGLEVKIFLFFWYYIPWIEVINLKPSPVPGLSDSTRWLFIEVERLTIFHRLIGLSYFIGINPVIFLNHNLSNFDHLVEKINSQIKSR